jgi:ribosome-binding factor A
VEVSPDFSIAHVQLSLLLDKGKDEMLEKVNANKGAIKRSLSQRIGKQARKIPDLVFHLDHGAENAQKMDKILKGLHIPPTNDN